MLHRDQMEIVTAELLKNETLDRETFLRLIGQTETIREDKQLPALQYQS